MTTPKSVCFWRDLFVECLLFSPPQQEGRPVQFFQNLEKEDKVLNKAKTKRLYLLQVTGVDRRIDNTTHTIRSKHRPIANDLRHVIVLPSLN